VVVVLLRRVVEFRIPAEVDIQPVVVRIHMVVRTEVVDLPVDTEPVVDIVAVVGIVVAQKVDIVSVLEQKLEQDMERELHLWWGTGLMQVQKQQHGMELMLH